MNFCVYFKCFIIITENFYWHLTFLFGGDIGLPKDAITELYKNLSYKILSDERQVEFDKISDLIAQVNFKMKYSIFSNVDDQDRAVKKIMRT